MSKKILLADDSITIQKVISITFSTEDYELTTVSDGDQAIEMSKALKPDLVMADVAMPGKNGYEVCEAVKSDPGLANTPVILLAGTFEPLNDDEAQRVKANDSIIKPFESQELLDKVSNLLEAGAAATAGAEAPEGVPGLDAAAGDWEEGDFLGLDEGFEEEAPAAPEETSDVGFLEGGVFEAPADEAPKKGGDDFFDIELNETEPAPAETEPAPAEAEQAPPELELTDMSAFSAPAEPEERPVEEAATSPALEPAPEPVSEPEEEMAPAEEAFEIEDFGDFGELEVEESPVEPAAVPSEPAAQEAPSRLEGLAEVLGGEPEEAAPAFAAAEEPQGFDMVEQAPGAALFDEPTEDILEPEPEFTDAVGRATEEVEQKAAEEVAARIKDSIDLPREQVEKIVSRVAKEIVEKVAWDVIPDLAEELIMGEINKFKSSQSKPK